MRLPDLQTLRLEKRSHGSTCAFAVTCGKSSDSWPFLDSTVLTRSIAHSAGKGLLPLAAWQGSACYVDGVFRHPCPVRSPVDTMSRGSLPLIFSGAVRIHQ